MEKTKLTSLIGKTITEITKDEMNYIHISFGDISLQVWDGELFDHNGNYFDDKVVLPPHITRKTT